MKNKVLRNIIVGAISALAALGGTWWIGGNVAVQIGGSNNKIEQKLDPTQSAKK